MRRIFSRINMNLNEAAYEQIRDSILDGTFPLGAPLTRRRLGEMFHMSLVPVAQALQRLEAEGLVESLPRVGTRVKVPTPDEVLGHYVLREALEAQVARMFVRSATKMQRRNAKLAAIQLDREFEKYFNVPAGSPRSLDVHRTHMRFHHDLAVVSNCDVLIHHIENSQVLHLNFRYSLAKPEPLPRNWHQQLVDALCTENEDEADRAMRKHVTYRRDEVIAIYEKLLAAGEPMGGGYRGPQRRTINRQHR